LEEHLTLYLLAIAVGILGGYGAILFRLLIKGFQLIFYQNSNDFLFFAREVPYYLKLLMPALADLPPMKPSPTTSSDPITTLYFRQNEGNTRTRTVKTSRRPTSMQSERSTWPACGRTTGESGT